MKDKAIAKITAEAMAIDDPLAFAIEEYLTDRCTSTGTAQKLLDENKKMEELHDQLMKKAMSKAKTLKGNAKAKGVYLDISKEIDAYYGLDSKPAPVRMNTERVDILDMF